MITTQTTSTTFMIGAGANWLTTQYRRQTTITRISHWISSVIIPVQTIPFTVRNELAIFPAFIAYFKAFTGPVRVPP